MKLSAVFLLFLVLWSPAGFARTARKQVLPQTFDISPTPFPAPSTRFMNENGKMISLARFRGKILLVNIWSTSCAQCVIELPMLDRLEGDMGGVKVQVVALSSDVEPLPLLRRFWVNRGIKHLRIYSDTRGSFSKAANVNGMPTTLLIDEQGREIGRIRGIVEWDGAKIKAQIRDLIRQAKEREAERLEREEREKQERRRQKSMESAAFGQNGADRNVPPPPAESVPPPPERPAREIKSWFNRL